jgi:hypothetical protein
MDTRYAATSSGFPVWSALHEAVAIFVAEELGIGLGLSDQ